MKGFSKRTIEPDDISVQLLNNLFPIRNLGEEKLQAFALDRKSEIIANGSTLFTIDTPLDSVIYLIKGVVTLSNEDGSSFDIDDTMAKSKFPLASSGAKHTMTAVAKTDVSILRVSQKIMELHNPENNQSDSLTFPEEIAHLPLLQAFSHHYQEEKLDIPSMPNIATKLYQAMQKDIGIADAVKIIQLDPVMSAKVVQVANCPLYYTSNPAKSCLAAVNRIGINATRNLVVRISMKQIYRGKSELIRKIMERTWKQSIYISSICMILAKATNKINPEEALLAGLISDIGIIPFLNFASILPADYYSEQDIAQAIPYIRGPVGAHILRSWDFSEELINIPMIADDWHQSQSDKLTLADIVVLSRLHSKIGTPEMDKLPPISSIPASSKLEDGTLSPDYSLKILHEAKSLINEAVKVFSA